MRNGSTMRLAPLVIAAAMTVGLGSATKANPCVSAVNRDPSLATAKYVGATACMSPRPRNPGAPMSDAQFAQYGMCNAPGAVKCVNGWVAVCQCFSYGCQWMATASRCGG